MVHRVVGRKGQRGIGIGVGTGSSTAVEDLAAGIDGNSLDEGPKWAL